MKRIFPCTTALVCAAALAACGPGVPAPTPPASPSAPTSSSSLSSGGEESTPAASGKPVEAGYQLHTITFPANHRVSGFTDEQTKNVTYPDTKPFTLSIQLPESWTLETPTDQERGYVGFLFSPVNICENGKVIGTVAYNPVDIFDYDDPPSPDDPGFYVGLYNQLMVSNVVSWDDDYTPVARTSTSCTATCRVSISKRDGDKPVEEVYHDGILSYNLSLLEYIAVEFADGYPASKDVLTTIAKSIVLAPAAGSDATPSPYTQTPAQSVSLTFPASDYGKTEHNASIFAIAPFSISFLLPEGWSAQESKSSGNYDMLSVWSKYNIYNADKVCVGVVGYNTYEPVEGAEDNPGAIYNQIALGNDYQFDVRDPDSYRVIKQDDSGVTALADVKYSASINDGAEKTNRGIVSYNKDKMVYVAFEFDSTQVSEEQVTAIAQSLSFE